jgi:hypothetical protein
LSDLVPSLSQREKVAVLVREFGRFPQVECPLKHYFAPGIYLREIFMPAGTIVIGKIHKTEHLNLIESGSVSIVHDDGASEILCAPHTFVSKPGVQKVLYIREDTVWRTIHPTEERDLERLESLLIESDSSYPVLDREMERLAILEASQT